MKNIYDIEFQEAVLLGKKVLVTTDTVDRASIPDGIYIYELRIDDEGVGDVVIVEKTVIANSYASVVTTENILPDGEEYLILGENDYSELTSHCKFTALEQKAMSSSAEGD